MANRWLMNPACTKDAAPMPITGTRTSMRKASTPGSLKQATTTASNGCPYAPIASNIPATASAPSNAPSTVCGPCSLRMAMILALVPAAACATRWIAAVMAFEVLGLTTRIVGWSMASLPVGDTAQGAIGRSWRRSRWRDRSPWRQAFYPKTTLLASTTTGCIDPVPLDTPADPRYALDHGRAHPPTIRQLLCDHTRENSHGYRHSADPRPSHEARAGGGTARYSPSSRTGLSGTAHGRDRAGLAPGPGLACAK